MPIEFAALVAIDWADQKHAWALQAGTSKVETGAIVSSSARLVR